MPAIDLTDEQAMALYRQLPAGRRLSVLRTLAGLAEDSREKRESSAEERVSSLCRQRGLHWDDLVEEEREAFMNELVHEDRKCGR